ncbi:hypothetical protein ABBQ38_012262 [Trebouxia sp. C0009 RCD-2024]
MPAQLGFIGTLLGVPLPTFLPSFGLLNSRISLLQGMDKKRIWVRARLAGWGVTAWPQDPCCLRWDSLSGCQVPCSQSPSQLHAASCHLPPPLLALLPFPQGCTTFVNLGWGSGCKGSH